MSAQLFARRSRGSVLLTALIFAAIIGISLVSYINLANNSLKQASRSFYSNSAMNIAEVGLERAIACFNQLDNSGSTIAWSGWAINNTPYNSATSPTTPSAKNTYTFSSLGPGASGTIKVYVQHYEGSTTYSPKIVAKASVTQTDGLQLEKYIEVTLRKRSLFANGLVAKDNVTWSGTPSARSWNSDPTGTGSPIYAYDPARTSGAGSVSANVTVGSLRGNIGLAGGEVWGYAKTGPSGTISGGSVHGLGTSADDATRRTNDFNATFPNVTTPTPTAVNTIAATITSSRTFPNTGTDASCTATINNITGTYYFYNFASGAGVTLNGTDTISIAAGYNVVFILNNHQGTTSFSTTGNASVAIASNATLNVYTNGNVSIAGNGLINTADQPKNCIFWGTRTSDGQTIDISGNGTLKAVVYAPTAVVSLNGGGSTPGDMLGAVVGKSINMNGHTSFVWDESLANITSGNPWGIAKWKELQSQSERSAYTSVLNF